MEPFDEHLSYTTSRLIVSFYEMSDATHRRSNKHDSSLTVQNAEVILINDTIILGFPYQIPVVLFNQLRDGLINETDSVRNLIQNFLHALSPSLKMDRVKVEKYNQQELGRLVNGIKSAVNQRIRNKLTFELIMFICRPFDKIIIRDIRIARSGKPRKPKVKKSKSPALDLDANASNKAPVVVYKCTSESTYSESSEESSDDEAMGF